MSEAEEAAKKLLATSDRGLLRTFAALTHRLDAAEAFTMRHQRAQAKELRTQRDVVENEILRRMKTDGVGS